MIHGSFNPIGRLGKLLYHSHSPAGERSAHNRGAKKFGYIARRTGVEPCYSHHRFRRQLHLDGQATYPHIMPQFRLFVFTAWTEPTVTTRAPRDGDNYATYCVYQEEVAPDTGTHHWQGYIELHRRGGIRDVKRILGGCKRTHVEPARSPEDANQYAQKEDTRAPGAEPVIIGEFGGDRQGERSDLASLAARARDGGTADIIRSNPDQYVKYHRGLERIAAAGVIPRSYQDPPPAVTISIGPTGSGKTRSAYDQYGDAEIYRKDASKWWDGYRDQKCVLFDDWVGSKELPPHELLQAIDRYPVQVQNKGGYVSLAKRTIHFIFTSNVQPADWYCYNPTEWRKALPAFNRRVSEWLIEIDDDEVPVKVEQVDADADV